MSRQVPITVTPWGGGLLLVSGVCGGALAWLISTESETPKCSHLLVYVVMHTHTHTQIWGWLVPNMIAILFYLFMRHHRGIF